MGSQVEHLEDKKLVENIQLGRQVNESLIELVNRHSGIYFSVVNDYSKTAIVTNMDIEHFAGSCEYTVFQAAHKFRLDKKTKFSSFLTLWTRWSVLNHLKESSKLVLCEDLYDGAENELHQGDSISEETYNLVVDIINNECDERVRDVFRLRYIDTKGNRVSPWREVAKHIPSRKDPSKTITVQGCINLHNKTLHKIRNGLKLKQG